MYGSRRDPLGVQHLLQVWLEVHALPKFGFNSVGDQDGASSGK
jgi:hypothetical protein